MGCGTETALRASRRASPPGGRSPACTQATGPTTASPAACCRVGHACAPHQRAVARRLLRLGGVARRGDDFATHRARPARSAQGVTDDAEPDSRTRSHSDLALPRARPVRLLAPRATAMALASPVANLARERRARPVLEPRHGGAPDVGSRSQARLRDEADGGFCCGEEPPCLFEHGLPVSRRRVFREQPVVAESEHWHRPLGAPARPCGAANDSRPAAHFAPNARSAVWWPAAERTYEYCISIALSLDVRVLIRV